MNESIRAWCDDALRHPIVSVVTDNEDVLHHLTHDILLVDGLVARTTVMVNAFERAVWHASVSLWNGQIRAPAPRYGRALRIIAEAVLYEVGSVEGEWWNFYNQTGHLYVPLTADELTVAGVDDIGTNPPGTWVGHRPKPPQPMN